MSPVRPSPGPSPAKKPRSFTQTTLTSAFLRRESPGTSKSGSTSALHRTIDGRIAKKPTPTTPKPKADSEAGSDNDRVLSDVLLSIKPVHLANIASRQKNHEYRKYRLRDGVTRLWFYETSEGGSGRASITHIATIPPDIRRTPGTVPLDPPGIGNEDFNAGRKQSRFGYPVLELWELVRPVTLAEMKDKWGMNSAPMGWRYVGRGLWEDRWGGEDADGKEDRGGRVRRVF